MRKKSWGRMVTILLAALLVVGIFPMSTLAADVEEPVPSEQIEEIQVDQESEEQALEEEKEIQPSIAPQNAALDEAVTPVPAAAPGSINSYRATVKDRAIELNWLPPSIIDTLSRYEVRYKETDSDTWSNWDSRTLSMLPNYTVNNLTNGVEYMFEVRAIGLNGEIGSASMITATPATTPGRVQNLSALEKDKSITLNWDAPQSDGGSEIIRYEVRQHHVTVTLPLVGEVWSSWSSWSSAGTDTSYTATGLTNGTKYAFEVRAVNSRGNGSAIEVITSPKPAPTTVRNLNALENDQSVDISWDAPTSGTFTGYWVSLDGTNWTNVGMNTSYTFTGLDNGMEYTIYVCAVNVGAQSPNATVKATPATTPDVPQSLSVTVSDGDVTLTWNAPLDDGGSAITKYQVSLDGQPWIDVDAADTEYLFAGLDNGTEYEFAVRAVNAKGEGAEDTIKAIPATVPNAPQNISAQAGDQEVLLTWDAPDDDKGRTILNYQVSSDGITWIDVIGTSYTFTGLDNDMEYTFYVRAVNEMGEGDEAQQKATPLSKYSYRTLVHESTGISATGYFTDGSVLLVTGEIEHSHGYCDVCDEMRTHQSEGRTLALHNISIDGEYLGDVTLSIPVGSELNGQKITVIHCDNGMRDERAVTVENGRLTDSFASFSPFTILKVSATENTDANTSDKTDNNSAKTDTTDTKETNDSAKTPKTGDSEDIMLWVSLALIACGSIVGLTIYRKKAIVRKDR